MLNVPVGLLRLQLQKMLKKFYELMMEYRRLKVSEMAKTMSISNEQMNHILHEHLYVQKVSKRWMPQLLTIYQMSEHKHISMNWTCFKVIKKNFVPFSNSS